MADIVIVIPVLQRPHRAQPVVDSIRATAGPDRARILFVTSPGDDAEQDACWATGEEMIVLDEPPGPGDWARKINEGYRDSDEPLILCGADDLAFHPGWLEAAETAAAELRVGVIGTNDLGNPRVTSGHHATHPIIVRYYADNWGTIDQPGQIAHEGYHHEMVDDEIVETAKARGAWVFAPDCIVEHLHPDWGKAPTDALYDARLPRMRQGRKLLDQRRHLWT